MLLASLVAGCASSRKPVEQTPVELPYSQRQEAKLAAAVLLLGMGNASEAESVLVSVCEEPGVPGVTDEALFRLAIFRLGATETEGSGAARQIVERLQREYPASVWGRQAAPLLKLLASTSDLRRANSDLQSLNLSLSKVNEELTRERNELRETLEKLKHLDLELEDKSR
jgi:hypothetical protein